VQLELALSNCEWRPAVFSASLIDFSFKKKYKKMTREFQL